MTPSLLMKRDLLNKKAEFRILVDTQIEIKGKRKPGSVVDTKAYGDLVADISKEYLMKYNHIIKDSLIFIDSGQAFVDIVSGYLTEKGINETFVAKAVKKGKNNH